MKKFLTITFSILLITIILTGCDKKVDDTDIDEDNEIEDSARKFTGEINTSWDEVEDDYDNIELEAKREVSNMNNVTTNDIKELTNTIQTKYASVKNGITDDNENDAKELYKVSIKLQEIAKKDGTRVDHEITTLAENAEALVKHYYGKADKDFDNVKEDFESGLENIKDYAEDKWQEFVDLLK